MLYYKIPKTITIPNNYKKYFLTNRYRRIINKIWEEILLLNFSFDCQLRTTVNFLPQNNLSCQNISYSLKDSSYLGINGFTDENGEIVFEHPSLPYNYRADHLGYQFWNFDNSDVVYIPYRTEI